jgi:uroporphyrinogen III methyltransferase/synthase
MKVKGKVFLVGAGPGAPDLITVRGRDCLRSADVILYDQLCNPFLLQNAQKRAEVIFAGKHAGNRSLSQEKIHRLMLRFARLGKRVVRLKGGDPLLFGRGAEEAEFLAQHRIDFEIVPGISSAIGVPAYAGIPLTHRELASGVALITAQENPGKMGPPLDYRALAQFPGSLVIFMAFRSLKNVVGKLTSEGKSRRTPAAVIQWGSRGIQKTVCGPLLQIEKLVQKSELRAPALAIIGEVVKCRRFMNWFEKRPLFGRRILVPRSKTQSFELVGGLRELGAEVLEIPLIEIEPIQNQQVRKVMSKVDKWDWVIFSSAWAVKYFFDEVLLLHQDLRILSNIRFAVLGESTRKQLSQRGFQADLMPEQMTSDGLIREVDRKIDLFKHQRVLYPKSVIGESTIQDSLVARGIRVDSISIYRNKMPKWTWEAEAIRRIGFDPVIFTSSSTVERYVALRKTKLRLNFPELKKICCISIGPTTSKTLKNYGFSVTAEARTPSVVDLLGCTEKSNLRF